MGVRISVAERLEVPLFTDTPLAVASMKLMHTLLGLYL